MAPQVNWPTLSSHPTGVFTLMTASTGSWAPRATAGRKVIQLLGLASFSPPSGLQRSLGQEGFPRAEYLRGIQVLTGPSPPSPPPSGWRGSWSCIPEGQAHSLGREQTYLPWLWAKGDLQLGFPISAGPPRAEGLRAPKH